MTFLRKVGAVICLLLAAFYGVPLLVWVLQTVGAAPDPVQWLISTVTALIAASFLWPGE